MATDFYYPTSKNAVQKTLSAQLLNTASTGDPITFSDVDGVQNKPGVLVINALDSNGEATPSSREYISFSGTSGTTVLIETRNVDGSASAKTHAVGSIVEFIPDSVWAQRIIDQFKIEHNANGTHLNTKVPVLSGGNATTLTTTGTTTLTLPTSGTLATQGAIQNSSYVYAADSVGTDSYAITLSPVPSAYATGQVFHFKAGTANTGAATLNVNSLGAKTIKKMNDQDLATGDIESGQIVTVAYDGTNFQMLSQVASSSATTFSGARVYHNANQSTSSGVGLALALNTERYDTDTYHDTSTNNSRLTIPTTGYYSVTGTVQWEANASGYRELAIRLNGTTILAEVKTAASPSESTILTVTTDYSFSASDYVELFAVQSGGTLNVLASGNFSPEFMIKRLG